MEVIKIAIIYSIASCILMFVLSFVFSLILTALNWFCTFLMKPFDFTADMFVAVFGKSVTEGIINVAISAGIAISVLLLVFGLLKVFTGKLSNDTPNPYALAGRFLIAIGMNYWIITVLYDYIFPFAQNFFDKALDIGGGQSLLADTFSTAVSNLTNPSGNAFDQIGSLAFDIGGVGILAEGLKAATTMSIGPLLVLIVFAIALIAVIYNIIKLVVENAERYFTINLLVITGPVASSTLVSEKSSVIFKSWFQLLISNILTVVFNIIGFRMLIFAFNNCMATWTQNAFQLDVAMVSLIALVAASKMVQKFDQLLALIAFKVNPIQNRSLIMSGLAGFSALDRGAQSFTGKGIMTGIQNGAANLNNSISQAARSGKFGSAMQQLQANKDLSNMNQDLEKMGFNRNAMDKKGNIAVGSLLKTENPNNVLNKVNSSLSNNGMKVAGFEGSGDDITLKTSELGDNTFEGKIAPDTLEAAFLGDDESKYTLTVPEGSDPTPNIPNNTYVSGKETIQKVDNEGKVSFADKFYLTKDKNYAMPKYKKSSFDGNN